MAKDEPKPEVDLKALIQLSRTAYDQKRRKESLALTKAILKINPASNEARVLQSLIESDIQQALQRINALVKNPRMKNDEDLRTNAYQMLQSVLEIDPENKAANALIPEIEPGGKRDPSSSPESKGPPEKDRRTERPGWTPPEVGPPEEFPTSNTRSKNYWIRYAALAALLLVIVAAAIHFGLVSSVLGWFGITVDRKSPSDVSMNDAVYRSAEHIAPHRPPGEVFFDTSASVRLFLHHD